MLPEELQKLQDLHEQGALSDEEFAAAKGRLLAIDRRGKSDQLMGLDLNNFLALMHGSQYANFIIPFTGFVAPIVLWSMAKDDYPEVEVEGKHIINWLISGFIYAAVSIVLIPLFGVGLLLLLGWLVVSFIFPLIGTIKATKGESYQYPLAITFLK